MLRKSIVLLFSVVQTRVSLRVSGGHAKRSPPAPPGRSRCARAFAGACSARVNARGRWRRPAVTACEATTLSAGTATVAPLLGSFRSRLPPAEPPRASPSRGAVRGLAGRGQRGPPGCRCPPARCPRAGQWPLQPSSRVPAWGVYRPPALSPARGVSPSAVAARCRRGVSTGRSAPSSFVTPPFGSCAHSERSSVIPVFSCRTSLFIQDTSPLSDVFCKHLLVWPCLFYWDKKQFTISYF